MHEFLRKRMDRYRSFYDEPEPGMLLLQICPYTFDVGSAPGVVPRLLNQWDPETEVERMAEQAVENLRWFLLFSRKIDCDYIPQVAFSYGIGPCSAFLTDAEVIPGQDTSWIHPSLMSWEDFQGYTFNRDNRWVRIKERFMKHCSLLWEGDFFLSTGSHMAPSDLANAIRGNDFFLDLYDETEKLGLLLGQCADAVIALHQHLNGYIPEQTEGSATGAMWFPNDSPFLSEDAADLVSPELYKKQLFPNTQRILDAIGGAYIHHHAKGWHNHTAIASLKHLSAVELSWDPNCPRPVDHLEEFAELSLKVPMQTRCTAQDIYQKMDEIMQCRLSLMVNVQSQEEAVEVVDFVRRRSRLTR